MAFKDVAAHGGPIDPSIVWETKKRWVDRFDYEEKPDVGVSLSAIEEVPVERSGYRTIGEQVDELTRAGETLADWRKAAFPFLPEFEDMMEPTPVFGDKLDVMDRFRWLQKRRKEMQEAQAAHAAEATAAPVAGKSEVPPSAVPEATK